LVAIPVVNGSEIDHFFRAAATIYVMLGHRGVVLRFGTGDDIFVAEEAVPHKASKSSPDQTSSPRLGGSR